MKYSIGIAAILLIQLSGCTNDTPGTIPVGGGAGSATNRVPSGNNAILAKEKALRQYPDTTMILLDKQGRIRVNDVIFQDDDFSTLLINHWEGVYISHSTLPVAFRIMYDKEAPADLQRSIHTRVTKAQDSVRSFIGQRETADTAALNKKYPILVQSQ